MVECLTYLCSFETSILKVELHHFVYKGVLYYSRFFFHIIQTLIRALHSMTSDPHEDLFTQVHCVGQYSCRLYLGTTVYPSPLCRTVFMQAELGDYCLPKSIV